MPYEFWLFAHLLMFVYWLGADVGVFGLALALRNPRHSVERRRFLMRFSLGLDLIPRAAFAFIGPVGLHLATRLELVQMPLWLMGLIWLAATAWVVAELIAYRNMGRVLAVRIYMGTGVVFLAGFLGFTGYGLFSLLTGSPFLAPWLALKVMLFGLVFLVSVVMAVFYAPLEGIFERMALEGSSTEMEARVRRQVNRGAVFTVLLFVLLASMGYLGLAKPF